MILPLNSLSAKGGQILLRQAMHSHQMDVSVLLPLELFATHVTGSVHVQLHVGVKLGKQSVDYVWELLARLPGIVLQKSCHSPPWHTCSWCCVFWPDDV